MISNVVGLSSVGVDITLKDLQRTSAPGVYYNPRKFSGTIIRLKKPRCTLLVFSNGRVVNAGGRSKADLDQAVQKLAKMLRRIGYIKAKAQPTTITNVVASSSLSGLLDIDKAYKAIDSAVLDKERFPGMSFELPSGGKAIAFASGKYFVTGVNEEDKALNGLKEAEDLLTKYVTNIV